MAELSGENGLVRGGRRAWGAAAVFLVVLGAGWFAWRGWGGTDGDDAGAFKALQRGQAERCFGGLVPVELGDLAAIERWLSEPECVDCVWLDSEDRRRIMAIVREFLSRRFAGSAEEYVAWRDGLPGRRTTMREQIDDEALPHRRRYQLGRALADDASFEEVRPVMFDRGITADGRPVGRIRLASGPGRSCSRPPRFGRPRPDRPGSTLRDSARSGSARPRSALHHDGGRQQGGAIANCCQAALRFGSSRSAWCWSSALMGGGPSGSGWLRHAPTGGRSIRSATRGSRVVRTSTWNTEGSRRCPMPRV